MRGGCVVAVRGRLTAARDGSRPLELAVSLPDPVLAPSAKTHAWVVVYRIGEVGPVVNATCMVVMGGRGLSDLHMVDCREVGEILAHAIERMGEGDASLRAALARASYGATLTAQHAYDPTLTVLRHAHGAASQFPTGRFEVGELAEWGR